ncbi:MAG TPA: hypothetical protein VNN12_05180, partial [Dehalococcoidia bacterium]|nr:hypothetical protein [Dehalococcoidia bacterium]
RVVCPSWTHPRALPAPEVARAFAAREMAAEVAPSVDAAVARARELALAEGGAICALGSIAFAAAVRECLLGIESDMMRLQSTVVEQP